MSKYSEGFLIVANMHAMYKNSAICLIDSLEEFYPDSKIMVVCPPQWKSEFELYEQVVEIRTDGPDERRTKLWALQHTIFEKTCYLDADMEVVSEEIKDVFKLLDEEYDTAFTVINPKFGASTAIYKETGEKEIRDNDIREHLRYHGGFFLWWNNDTHPNAVKSMSLWWEMWNSINKNEKFWDDNPQYFYMNRSWDQFTWWYITQVELPELKVQEVGGGLTPEGMKWNCSPHYTSEYNKEILGDVKPVIMHYPINREVMNFNSPEEFFTGSRGKAGGAG